MSTDASEVSLRVLFTVNTSPQYILARGPDKIPFVSVESSSPSNSLIKYGKAPLRACAVAICCSSPELRPDVTKDFSVYILDPVEDLASRNRHGQSGGVAVGMGFLSRLLSPYTPDTITVTGTFVGCGQGEDALEVVVSLKQVAPPIIHPSDSDPHKVSGPSGRNSNSRRFEKDQPYFTSRPLPLPSLDERLFTCYPRSYDTLGSRPKEPRKPNPSHSTRAHQLPTPYIGPPKRKYVREMERRKDEGDSGASSTDLGSEPSQPVSEAENNGKSPEPSDPETLTRTGVEFPASSSSSQARVANRAPDLSEAAVMMAALSSVSCKPINGETPLSAQANPSPELIQFLRAYLALLETQKQSSESVGIPSPWSSQSSTIQSRPARTELLLSNTMENKTNPEVSEDKENQRPSPTAESLQHSKANHSEHIAPLGLGLFNSRLSVGSSLNRTVSENLTSSSASRKRKLSNAARSEQTSQTRRRSSSVSNLGPPTEDLSGVRQNRGWGGLRVRSDGTLWGEQPPRQSSYTISGTSSKRSGEQPAFFRSSGQLLPVPVRKGPYIVPDWAKGVPPPAPPPRPEGSNEGEDQTCSRTVKRLGKSKSFSRLGGKRVVKRTASGIRESETLSTSEASTAAKQCTQKGPSGNSSSTKVSPGRPPIFAYSSPVGKSRMASLFQAFRTSPYRLSGMRKALPSTCDVPSSMSPSGSESHPSLFTPSPSNSILKTTSGHKSRKFFEREEPPSPTPTRRRTLLPKASADRDETKDSNENDNLPSSLPIASSDSVLDDTDSLQPLSISSDSTIMNFTKVHDWSSLDLPPSSPPPPSSPSITPVEGNDLPCSGMSRDVKEIGSPCFTSDLTISNYPSRDPDDGQTHPLEMAESNTEFNTGRLGHIEDTGTLSVTDTFLPFDLTREEGPAAFAALEALQNGLGQEDFSEGWNLLNSLLHQLPTGRNTSNANSDGEPQNRSWISDDFNSTSGIEFDDFFSAGSEDKAPALEAPSGEDPAVLAAANLKGLLDGCVV